MTLLHARNQFDSVPHIGRVLGDAGYDTFFTGKWHNGENALRGSYQQVGPWAGGMLPSTQKDGDAYRRPSEGNHWDPSDRSQAGHWLQVDGSVAHSSEVWTDAAASFLQSRSADRPFFLHVAYHAPHDPRQAPEEYLAMYPPECVRVPPNAWPEHPFDNGDLLVRDELLAPHPRTDAAVRLHRQEYFAILTHADAQIGRLLDVLEATGSVENSLIVLSGDHGLALGEHGLMGKQNPYDHSIRVPLVFAGPGVPAGRRIEDLVYSASIYATICDLVGVDTPTHIEFASLAAAITGQDSHPLPAVVGAYRDDHRLVRTATHKLVVYPRTNRLQLFDVIADPWEIDDVSHGPHAGATIMRLLAQLRELQAELDDNLPLSADPASYVGEASRGARVPTGVQGPRSEDNRRNGVSHRG